MAGGNNNGELNKGTEVKVADQGCLHKFTSCRWTLAFLLLLLRMCQTALRQNIGMALVCMAERPPSAPFLPTDNVSRNHLTSADRGRIPATKDGVSAEQAPSIKYSLHLNSSVVIAGVMRGHNSTPDDLQQKYLCDTGDREFLWDAAFEGLVLSSYYYGYLITPLLSSYLERVVGAKRLVAVSVGMGAVINLLTPQCTRAHQYLLVALRVLAGTTNGMIDPAIQSLWAAWAPKPEVAYLCAVEYTGVSLGGIFTFLISGLLCQIPVDNGWPFVFYFYGSMSLLLVALWLALAYNRPQEHPRISPEELDYILANTQPAGKAKEQRRPPWTKIFCSGPVWAIVVSTTTFMWVYSWVLAYLPMYMQDVLLFKITENALLSSLPFAGKFITGLLCGYLADKLLRTKMSVSCNRKTFQMIGCVGCSICTLVISFLDHNSRDVAVVLLILAVATQNITSVAFRINALDIAPRYAGFILGLSSTVAVAVSMTAPLVTSAVVIDKTQEQWQIMFYVVAALSLVGGLVFLFLSSGKLQPWSHSEESVELEVELPPEGQPPIVKPMTSLDNKKGRGSLSEIGSSDSVLLNEEPISGLDGDLDACISDVEVGSYPGCQRKAPRHLQKSAVAKMHDLDASSQWSSSLSLTGC